LGWVGVGVKVKVKVSVVVLTTFNKSGEGVKKFRGEG